MATLSAINQDYAWGQDSRADFVAAAEQLYPGVKVQTDLLPKFGAGQYGTEISALVGAGSDVVYSSLWGGDLQAFILQSAPRGLPKRSQLVFSAADHVLPPLGDKMPDGTIIGARGAYGLMSQKSPLNDWLFDLKTGYSLNGNCNIKTYSASVEPDGTVMVEVDDGEEVTGMPGAGTMVSDIGTGTSPPA